MCAPIKMGDAVQLQLKVKEIELIYDELDTNAINFQLNDGYFSIQTGVFLEEDERLNEPYIEYNDQGNSQTGGIKAISFHDEKLIIQFTDDRLFIGEYSEVEILISEGVTRTIVDFFNNHLFLGAHASYSDDFNRNNISPPTQTRDYL